MIKRLRVQNYKALVDVNVDLGRINVLVGPNDSGKTSFLEAIGAFGRSADRILSQAFVGPWDGCDLVTGRDPTRNVLFDADLITASGPRGYRWSCIFRPKGRDVILEIDAVTLADNTKIFFQSKGRDKTFPCRVGVDNERTGDSAQSSEARVIHDALSGTQTYRFEPSMLALPAAPDSSRRFRMDPSGFGLALCLDDILGFDRERFASIEQRLRSIFPTFRSIQLMPRSAYRAPPDAARDVPALSQADGKGLYCKFDGLASPVPASELSDGVLLVIAYLTVLSLPEPPRLLLIEEPENGIHPKRLGEVVALLRSLVVGQSECQIVMTTHSPYVVDLFEPSEVYACRKTADAGVVVQRLSSSRRVREQIQHFTLGEIWTAEGEEALGENLPPVTAGQ
jgi:energy-coupling factor transporter ATP-binding protein EcfA2